MIDTHCHLNFKAFKKSLDIVVNSAIDLGITHIVVPGTDVETSREAINISKKFPNLYPTVGIHPHHAYEFCLIKDEDERKNAIKSSLDEIEEMVKDDCVVAVGEIGMDLHPYDSTKYGQYELSDILIDIQKDLFLRQAKYATVYNKPIIIHNREAIKYTVPLFTSLFNRDLEGQVVFHCCEADNSFIELADKYKFYIGVDGDVTFIDSKAKFIRDVPLERLVLETDSPYLLPEPLKSKKAYPNKPENIFYIASEIARLKNEEIEKVIDITTQNAMNLFFRQK